MSECEEIALNIWAHGPWPLISTQDEARFIVKRFVDPDESKQIVDNVAEALLDIRNAH